MEQGELRRSYEWQGGNFKFVKLGNKLKRRITQNWFGICVANHIEEQCKDNTPSYWS